MAASARLFRQLAVRATAATGATTLLAANCDGTKPPGTRELNRLPTKTGEAPKLQRLPSKDADLPEPPSTPASTASTRLHGLVETRDVEGLRSLLRDGHVNLAARNGDGLTALLVAARLREHEAAEIIRLLTDAGASVDDIDRLGRGALHLAALAGNPATTRVLLQRGADPRRVDARRGATPAHYAAAFARVDAMAMLCAHDAKAVRDARDRLGRSPLHWSARKIERYDKRTNTILRVRVVDTPGFGNNIDHKHAVRPITKYIRKCRDEQFRAETGARKETEADGDRLVHACVYFISPHRFLEIDRHFLRHVQRELAIVPVIAKTDTLTDEELAEYRAMLRDEFTKNNIQVYDFGEKSSELLEKRAFARGRERGEPLGIIARDGHYPWGTSQFQFAAHSDFALLKDLLLSEHTEPLVEHASARYARYRARRVRLGYATDAAKSLAVLALVGRALGLPVPIPSRAGVVAVLKRCGLGAAGLYRKLFVKPEAPPRRRSWFDFSPKPPAPPRRRWMEPLRRRLSPPPAPPPRRRSVAPLFPARALRGAKN